VDGFFVGMFATTLEEDEILTEIRVPAPAPGSGGAYIKLERKVGDFAIVGVAAVVTLQDGVCTRAGIGLTNVGPIPIKAAAAEQFLQGKRPDGETVRRTAQLAADESEPEADLRGSAEYKRDLVRVLTARAINRAVERAGQGS
jgi:carbon-monoxide dehydrogenase medium subunit